MEKRAIYLDDREQALAYLVFQWALTKATHERDSGSAGSVEFPALQWFENEVAELQAKFKDVRAE